MSRHKYGTLLKWASQLAPGAIICTLVFAFQPPSVWPVLAGPAALYVALIVGFALWVARDRRVDPSLRAAGTVAFVTQNVPGAIVHIERFVVPDAGFARGPSFVIVAGNTGLIYFTRGKNPVAFVRIPWSQVADVSASGGDLVMTLVDDDLVIHIPGGMLPMGRRRVRALADEIDDLRENSGSVRADVSGK